MNTAILVSGGVDSAVSLALLHKEGWDITPFYCKVWLEDEFNSHCPWEEDISYARELCKRFGLSLEIEPLQTAYYEKIVSYVIDQLKKGFTPNPDVLCNQFIKFGAFLDLHENSFSKIASGHYAATEKKIDGMYLKTAPDPIKDQSYFLSRLSQKQLARAVFPIGTKKKREVRALAKEFSLPNAERKDSQGICFLGKIRYPTFIEHYLGQRTGPIREFHSKKYLGDHHGYWFHTIGQRRGLGLSGGPWYVCEKEVESNIVYVRHARTLDELGLPIVAVTDVNWIPSPIRSGSALVKIRHGEEYHRAIYHVSEDKNYLYLAFYKPEKGISPGQFAVIYIDGYVRASGCIAFTLDENDPLYEKLDYLRSEGISE